MTIDDNYDENLDQEFNPEEALGDDYELDEDEVVEDVKTDTEEKKGNNYYVDKEKLYNCYVDWYAACDIAKAEGKDRPDPPRYISESIIKICQKIASRYNFAGYPFRDDMVGDAIENIFRYIDRFDTTKSQNPFGYFSITAYWAMVRRIKNEKLKAAVKYHMIINSGVLDAIQTQDHDDGIEYQNMLEHYQMQSNDSLADLIKPVRKKKKIKEPSQGSVDIESMF